MGALFQELGINAPALIAQAVNFGVVIVSLTFLVYKPLTKLMAERANKIAQGLIAYDKGKKRLAEIEQERTEKLTLAEGEAMNMIRLAEATAREREKQILEETSQRSEAMIKQAKTISERTNQEGMRTFERDAIKFVKDILIETVRLDPKAVHEKLIEQAVQKVRKI